MASKVLIQQNNVVQAYPIQSFSGTDSIRIFQFNPQANVGFTGAVIVEGSYAANPGNSDFTELVSVTFTQHKNNLTLEVSSTAPNIRARIVTAQQGAITVIGNSATRAIQGTQGASPATATVDSPLRVAGSGNNFKINSAVVPSITSDDVIYANNFGWTLTEILDGVGGAPGKQDRIGSGNIVATDTDLNLLAGMATAGLTQADFTKLNDLAVSAAEINRLTGITGNVQTQIGDLAAKVPAGIAGQVTTGATIDSFFNAAAQVSISNLNNFSGLSADAADLNVFAGTANTFTAADLAKLNAITASAAEINKVSGFSGTSADLNRIVGLTASKADINAVTGLAGTTVTATQLAHLAGLTQNVQAALNTLPSLTGLSVSVNDLNTFTGIFSGSGAYPAPITATEFSYLNGLTANIQNQLDARRRTGVPIGISEISGASITTTELNYLQGARSNIQAQIDSISVGSITPAGGTFTGPVRVANGTAAAPSLSFGAPNTTTGMYLFGANGIGLSVAGTRFISINGTDVVIGGGSTSGSPTLKGVGMGVTDPAYSFTNDTDTGVYRAAADSIGLAAGGEAMATFDAGTDTITIGGTASNNNDIVFTGVFAGEKVLGKASVAAGSVSGATGQTTLYTVGTGRSAVVSKVLVILKTVNNFSDGSLLRMNIGFGASYDEIVDNTNNTTIFNPAYGFSTAGQVLPLGVGDNTFPAISGSSGADYQVLSAGAVLRADVTAVAGANDFTMDVIVFGYEF